MRRRDCLKCLAAVIGAGALPAVGAAPVAPKLTPPQEIEAIVARFRPMLGGKVPEDLKNRLGATHYAGKYHLTDEPFLIEGCKALLSLGMRVAKLWLGADLPGYGFNSTWNLKPTMRLVDCAKHPYFAQAFAMPFSTFVLEIAPISKTTNPFPDAESDYAEDESQFYELARHLYAAYGNRDVTFILQHWEGDWMLRREAGAVWKPGGPADIDDRCRGFAAWLAARQRGVSRARSEAQKAKCRVYHAAEVNRVWDAVQGIPTVTSHVLPHVAVDLVSWSSYDGMANAVQCFQGIELIRHYMQPSPALKEKAVYIGEVGNPEQGKSEKEIIEWWDMAMGVFLAQKIPWILHWELYCNELASGVPSGKPAYKADELRGFWLIRPDGSLSFSGKYLKSLLSQPS